MSFWRRQKADEVSTADVLARYHEAKGALEQSYHQFHEAVDELIAVNERELAERRKRDARGD